MYSIFDHDIGDYLHTGRNSPEMRQCLFDYLLYREQDLEENELNNRGSYEDWANYIVDNDVEYVMQDMACCNFELVEHEQKIDDD